MASILRESMPMLLNFVAYLRTHFLSSPSHQVPLGRAYNTVVQVSERLHTYVYLENIHGAREKMKGRKCLVLKNPSLKAVFWAYLDIKICIAQAQ